MSQTRKRRVDSRAERHVMSTYEDGSAVRKLQPAPEESRRQEKKVSKKTMRNRKRAMQMSRLYVAFLALMSVFTLMSCVKYLQMKSEITNLNKEIATKESNLSNLKADNDAYYNKTIASLDMEKVKDTAINELGMKYADESQIQEYSTSGNSYVRQYQDIPDTE